MSNVLVIGSGGREHAISWKLSQSSKVKHVYVLPGNGGTSSLGTKVSNVQGVSLDPSTNFQQILQFVKDNQISLVFVGPEQPLVDGISDVLKRNGVPSFGPSSKAANIEASKAFSKDFMSRHKIPTAEYKIFTKYEEALDYLNNVKHSVVLKASGLAAGKGVLIPENKEQAIEALKTLMVTKPFGKASDEVVIEQRLEGPEVSVLAFTDGYTVSIMPPAQDHKRIGNDDTGENTGGMGAYAPAPLVSAALLSDIKNKVIQPTIDGLRKEGKPYVGVIYAGILLDKTTGINVLEFNCRFGDPETQVLLPLLQTDLYDICEASVEGRLDSIEISWKSREFSAVTVVMASKGYPGTYETNKEITGLNNSPVLPTQDDLFIVFHAGTKETNGRVTTSGGRVLNVTYVSKGLETSVLRAYEQIKSIHFDGAYYRTDIALKALKPGSVEHSGTTYKDSGVDIDSADNLIDLIGPLAKATARTGTDAALGGFGGLFDLKATGYKDPILVSGTDGVGTKLLIAQAVGKHDTIGIDLVAMSVNDILVQGAEPLFFLDYYATGKLQVDVARDVIAGVADGCKQSMCALIGGETAEMPGMYPGGKYDLAGFAVGVVERDQVLPKKLDDGDILIGLHSSGVHSNGFSLVRHVIEKNNLTFHDPCPFDPKVSLGVALLAPTRLYVKACMPLLRKGLIKAMAHITGGGIIENLPRVLSDDITAEIDLSSWPLPPVFQWLSKAGKIEKDELIRTFNCGIGLVVAIKKSDYEEVASTLKANGEEPRIIGSIVKRAEKPVIFKNNWKTQTAFH